MRRLRGSQRRPRWVIASALLAISCVATTAEAETASVALVKAAFLYNFAKFTEWPADVLPPGQRLVLCVVGDSGVADALSQTIKGHAIEGHELSMQVIKIDGARGCHLVYVTGGDAKRATAALRTEPILTVSDADRFAESGGVAQLVVENDRIRFNINVMAADRARLHLSSKLLSLARLVKDE